MYHITSYENAKLILQNGFDVSKSHRGAFGLGINLSSDINHLRHYYNKDKTNYIIKCNVKFNKEKKNYTQQNSKGNMKWVKNNKGVDIYTKPKYTKPPKGYNSLYVPGPEIYVIPTSQQVYPSLIGKVNKNTFT